MTDISYSGASVPVREELPAAHNRVWQRLAKPGYWWTGAERVAIAAEVRNAWQCALCTERKAALSPYTISGAHERVSELPDVARDIIHRVTTDSGRLTQAWYHEMLASGQIGDPISDSIRPFRCSTISLAFLTTITYRRIKASSTLLPTSKN